MISASVKIEVRMRVLRDIRDSYMQYQRWRVAEHDHHGAWDVAINLSETECEIAGLQFALEAIRESEDGE